MKNFALAAACATCAFGAIAGNAAVTVYTDRAAFLAAAGTTQTETFESSAVGAFSSSGGVFNQAFDGFSYSGQNNGNYVGIANGAVSDSGPNYPVPAEFDGQNYLAWANTNTGGAVSMTLTLNAATTAFGFDWFNTDFSDQYTFSVTGGPSFTGPPFTVVSGGSANSGFFGLISDSAFSDVTITNTFNGGYISDEGFDNLTTNGVGSSNPSPAPEPASWAMMLGGFGLIGGALRRRQRTTVSFG